MLVRVAPDLASIVRLGVLVMTGAANRQNDAALTPHLAAAESAARAAAPADPQPVRGMYRRIGLDPTRTRPSSEALLRRVRKGDPLPRINTLVDVVNWCSLERQLPYGLYDLARLELPVDLRLGHDGEEYEGIRKDVVHVQGRLTLADRRGAFGNPTSDSARTMVTADTTEALCVVFAPSSLGTGDLGHVLDLTASRFSEFTGARELERAII